MTDPTVTTINQLKSDALTALSKVTTPQALEEWRVHYLGRKGALPLLLRGVKSLPDEQRRVVGELGNTIRQEITAAFEECRKRIGAPTTAPLSNAPVDFPGHLHPLTRALRHLQTIFIDMGFTLVEGPSVEESRYNFDDLNIAAEHPARAETDTYYLQGLPDLVLRTHVSPLQIRAIREGQVKPPCKMAYFGPSFRAEKEDATHGALFQQYEFMVISPTVTLADLQAVATTLYSRFFNTDMQVRFRPAYFPFVEPGLEVDMQDTATSKGGWLEMAGAGMVHPHVLRALNLDPREYQGIALGGGLDRLAMLKYGIPDIRLLYEGDLAFLRQF